MAKNHLDHLYAAYANRTKAFSRGWGDREWLEELINKGLQHPQPLPLEVSWHDQVRGRFRSPYPHLPVESHYCEFEFHRPGQKDFPVIVHIAASGDQGLARRRRLMAQPLKELGIGSVIFENPYYGRRRPPDQMGSTPRTVADLWHLALGTVTEALSLLGWLEQQGYHRLGVSGISRGGQFACQVACLYSGPLALAALLPPHSARVVFLEGILSSYCDWKALGPGARIFMADLMNLTCIEQAPPPHPDTQAVIVGATGDEYVPPYSVQRTASAFRGSQLSWLDTGHVGAVLFHRHRLVEAVCQSLQT